MFRGGPSQWQATSNQDINLFELRCQLVLQRVCDFQYSSKELETTLHCTGKVTVLGAHAMDVLSASRPGAQARLSSGAHGSSGQA